jgi:hypothetical protein
MRDKLTRVNIILSKEQHDRFKHYAKRYHGSLSQLLRVSAENEMDRQEENTVMYLRSLIEGQSKLQQHMEHMKNNTTKKETSNTIPTTAREIRSILMSSETPLSIPDLTDYMNIPPEEMITAIEWLLDHCIITTIQRTNAPSQYKIRGIKL